MVLAVLLMEAIGVGKHISYDGKAIMRRASAPRGVTNVQSLVMSTCRAKAVAESPSRDEVIVEGFIMILRMVRVALCPARYNDFGGMVLVCVCRAVFTGRDNEGERQTGRWGEPGLTSWAKSRIKASRNVSREEKSTGIVISERGDGAVMSRRQESYQGNQ